MAYHQPKRIPLVSDKFGEEFSEWIKSILIDDPDCPHSPWSLMQYMNPSHEDGCSLSDLNDFATLFDDYTQNGTNLFVFGMAFWCKHMEDRCMSKLWTQAHYEQEKAQWNWHATFLGEMLEQQDGVSGLLEECGSRSGQDVPGRKSVGMDVDNGDEAEMGGETGSHAGDTDESGETGLPAIEVLVSQSKTHIACPPCSTSSSSADNGFISIAHEALVTHKTPAPTRRSDERIVTSEGPAPSQRAAQTLLLTAHTSNDSAAPVTPPTQSPRRTRLKAKLDQAKTVKTAPPLALRPCSAGAASNLSVVPEAPVLWRGRRKRSTGGETEGVDGRPPAQKTFCGRETTRGQGAYKQ
jgi:hypothetical protein